jgi:hypothetical protein
MDRHGAEVRIAFETAGIPCVLLKGRAFAELLYPGEPRSYEDTDLLVPPGRRAEAESILRRLGFLTRTREIYDLRPKLPNAVQWHRPGDNAQIDLHWRLPSTRADAQTVWDVVWRHTDVLTGAGPPARILDSAASAALCALHAAAHALRGTKARQDLDRAIGLLPADTWIAAGTIAEQMDAKEAFAAGLLSTAPGRRLAATLGLPSVPVVWYLEREARSARASRARTVARLLSHPTCSAKVKILAGVLFPPPDTMRSFHPLARRGPAGLAVSYIVRPARLLWLAPRTLMTFNAARHAARAPEDPSAYVDSSAQEVADRADGPQ